MNRLRWALVVALIVAASGCATPMPPSGGPPDDVPPALEVAVPEQGAVNVDAESVRLTFSEHVDQASFIQAFSISPSFTQPVEFDWRRRTVTVRFPEPLRDNTTYVLTIDTNLRDLHRVALSSPIVYAFSTGPTISAGTLSGRIVAWPDGAPAAGVDVLAFARADSTAPDSLPDAPAYRTQTSSNGTFAFDFLTEQFYFVPALRDDNRNLVPDLQEPFAVPPAPAIFADSTNELLPTSWVLANVDTTRPAALGVQSSARTRQIVRFSEPVRFLTRDPTRWTLADSSTREPVGIHLLYMLQAEPRQVHVITNELERRRYHIMPAAMADTSGNLLAAEPLYFTPAPGDDTLRTRFTEFLPRGLPAGEVHTLPREIEPGLRFNRPIDESLLRNAVSVADSMGADRAFVAVTENGTDYDILTDPRLLPGDRISVSVDASQLAGPDTTYSRSYRRLPDEETGEIAGVARTTDHPADPDVIRGVNSAPVVVQAFPVEVDTVVPDYTASADSTGSFVFSGLPAGTYRLRAFADVDSSGTWDPGRLTPYSAAEGVTWQTDPVRVRSRWETTLPDTLRIVMPRTAMP